MAFLVAVGLWVLRERSERERKRREGERNIDKLEKEKES